LNIYQLEKSHLLFEHLITQLHLLFSRKTNRVIYYLLYVC
jgi:hypothetical protein